MFYEYMLPSVTQTIEYIYRWLEKNTTSEDWSHFNLKLVVLLPINPTFTFLLKHGNTSPASSVNFSEKSNQNNFHKISPLYYVCIPVPTNVAYRPTQCPRCAILIASQGALCLSRIISLPSQTFPSTKAIISCTVKQNTFITHPFSAKQEEL